MEKDQFSLLKDFVELCKETPTIVHIPELKFYKDWLER